MRDEKKFPDKLSVTDQKYVLFEFNSRVPIFNLSDLCVTRCTVLMRIV